MEGDAGTSRLNPSPDADDTPEQSVAVSPDDTTTESTTEDTADPALPDEPASDGRCPSRLGRGWLAGICTALLLLTAGGAAAGYLALRSHQETAELTVDEASALQAAKDCVSATQAPDTTAMTTGQAKIIECSTGDFGAQAALYSGMLVDAYRAANVQVQVSDMRAAVEKHNDDGSIDVLVAVRVKVTNSDAANQEQGYRLRVQMAQDDGKYKVAKLDQVTS